MRRPAPCPHLLPFLWTFHNNLQSQFTAQRPRSQLSWPGTKAGVFCVWWLRALGHIFRLQRQASVPSSRAVSAPLSSSAVHSSIIHTLCYSQGASQNIQSVVSCDTDNNQQPTAWRSLTARSSNKTPRPPRRGMFSLEIRVSKIQVITCYVIFSYSIMQAILGGVMVAVGYNYTWEHHNGGNVDGVSTEE